MNISERKKTVTNSTVNSKLIGCCLLRQIDIIEIIEIEIIQMKPDIKIQHSIIYYIYSMYGYIYIYMYAIYIRCIKNTFYMTQII